MASRQPFTTEINDPHDVNAASHSLPARTSSSSDLNQDVAWADSQSSQGVVQPTPAPYGSSSPGAVPISNGTHASSNAATTRTGSQQVEGAHNHIVTMHNSSPTPKKQNHGAIQPTFAPSGSISPGGTQICNGSHFPSIADTPGLGSLAPSVDIQSPNSLIQQHQQDAPPVTSPNAKDVRQPSAWASLFT
ncbi:hypothetical protein F0562_024033 [Nyssa sinensis]|uniref:Uncharacterized protein n=1 Tax=Nyssa sinensis TaxID=561372 RepID=A0A5J5BNZ6_9ASTE|nr:hypothetical protein F0562_024033 [Nyssa sinensis]